MKQELFVLFVVIVTISGCYSVSKQYSLEKDSLIKRQAQKYWSIRGAHKLLKELGAESSLRVTIRIGLFRGFASIERGSVIWITTKDFVSNLSADRSLLSDQPVYKKYKESKLGGFIFELNNQKFAEAIHAMFPYYFKLAAEKWRQAKTK